MPPCTEPFYWQPVLTYVLPPVGALLSATALWVGSRARITSEAALSTSLAVARRSDAPSRTRRRNESALAAQAQRKP